MQQVTGEHRVQSGCLARADVTLCDAPGLYKPANRWRGKMRDTDVSELSLAAFVLSMCGPSDMIAGFEG